METFYLVIVGVLFLLAISDLVVGVSNDAVNFLNSAIGAKVASFRIIMIIAALGVFVGATFSSGMMEVARKGIFNPQHFFFDEVMIIFLAVMITDILLLDGFNTLGMPTSTTVSIVFELLGAAVAISILKISSQTNALPLYEYINTAKAAEIIFGILLSVAVAFTVGMIVQWFSRLLFSFNYAKRLKYFGSIFGGIAITAITYFMLVKGVKGAVFMTEDAKKWVAENGTLIMAFSFIGWTVVMQILTFFKVNILKIVVFVGTFALAMAFAGNDLVNFIGVPLAGFQSYKHYVASAISDPESLNMSFLAGKVKTDTYLLVIAGLIMVVTLWTSKKAKSVVKTSIDLSRQDEGEERFGSSALGRSVVRMSRNMSTTITRFIPNSILQKIDKQFDQTEYNAQIAEMEDPPAFDLIRASVNLVVASVLIAIATSLKLPLSTTYVTFMVAMGTSLADKAWGRESAVYRVTGVFSVIGGWFLTALIAFTSAFIMANLISWGGAWAILILTVSAGIIIFRTQRIHKVKLEKEEEKRTHIDELSHEERLEIECLESVLHTLVASKEIYLKGTTAAMKENLKKLRKAHRETKALLHKAEVLKADMFFALPKNEKHTDEEDLRLYQITDYLWESCTGMLRFIEPLYQHIDNNHKTFNDFQQKELKELNKAIGEYFDKGIELAEEGKLGVLAELEKEYKELSEVIKKTRINQLKHMKAESDGTRVNLLYSDIMHETIFIMENTLGLCKAYHRFVSEKK